MGNKFETITKNILYWVFFASFAALLVGIVFLNPYFDYKPYIVLPVAGVWFVIFAFIYKIVKRNIEHIENNLLKFGIVFFVILTIVQILLYNVRGGYPTRDFANVFTGAYNYTITGKIEDPYLDYFYKYPNNLPITVVLQFIFRIAHKFGIENYFVIGSVFNALCIDLTYLFTFLSVKKIDSTKNAVMAILILFFCLPLQTYISIFYTDTTSMLYPPAILYFYLLLGEENSLKKKVLLCRMFGLLIGFGMKIKYSVAIMVIAVAVRCILKFEFKKMLSVVLSCIVGFSAAGAIFDGFIYKHILDKDKSYDMQTPYIAWIAMGMQGDGTHSSGDNHFVWAHDTHEEKVEAAEFLLKARLEYMGAKGYVKFLGKKAIRSFGSGNLDYPNTVSDSPMHQNIMIDILNSQGKYNFIYDNIIQGYHILIFTMIVAGMAMGAVRKNRKYFVAQLASFGMLLFLLLWEAGTRYLLNYYPIFIMSALPAIEETMNKLNK